MFEYFPDNYPWSMAVLTALEAGGIISEIDSACRPLRDLASADADAAIDAWIEGWSALGGRLESQAEADERAGHSLSAGEKYGRCANYLFMAEQQASPGDTRKRGLYERGLAAFRRGVEARGEAVEFVEIPYEGGVLPALFVPAQASGPAPCIVHLNGLDSTKESGYAKLAHGYAQRGIASLFCDQPGSGGALRLHDLPTLVEMERPVAACIDALERRSDVDPERIGVLGVSMGGYFAPRAAAFEPRLACCVVLGAFYDFLEVARTAGERGPEYANSTSDMQGQMIWVTGSADFGSAVGLLSGFTLDKVAERIRCPLLVVHGGRDRQAPRDHGQKTYDAASEATRRDLFVLDDEHGGVEHCSIDNVARARALTGDWIAEVLRATPLGRA